jgi:6-phosphofructokinase 2
MTQIVTLALNPSIDISSDANSVRTAHKVRTSNETYDPGGGGVNVARVIAELGGDVEAFYLAGGFTGSLLDELLERDRIPRRLIRITGNTRISFTVHERKTGLEYRFVANGPTMQEEELESCIAAIRACQFGYFVASGSLPSGVPPDFYATVAKIVAAKGGRFILDSSGPGLNATLEHASVFLVKPSLSELEALTGHSLDERAIEAAAVDLVRRGAAEIVAITMGPAGALIATRRGVLRAPALEVEARSTVGAGDSFLGALTLALASSQSIEDSLKFATAAGAAAVLHPGTKLCKRQDVVRLQEEARRQPVEWSPTTQDSTMIASSTEEIR